MKYNFVLRSPRCIAETRYAVKSEIKRAPFFTTKPGDLGAKSFDSFDLPSEDVIDAKKEEKGKTRSRRAVASRCTRALPRV